MLEKSVVVEGRWRRRLTWMAIVGVASSVGIAALQPREILVTMLAPILPPATVVVQAPPPPAVVPTPPPPPPAPPATPTYGTTCVADVEHLGIPPAQLPQHEYLRSLGGVTASPVGCVIAAWTERTLHVSWDGGATFATLDAQGDIANVSAAADRVAVMRRDDTIGLVGRDGTWTFRPKLAGIKHDSKTDLDPLTVELRGAWLFEARRFGEVIAASNDDGATWRYIAPPKDASLGEVALDGALTAFYVVPDPPGTSDEDPTPAKLVHYRYDPAHPGWHRAPDPGAMNVAGWHYQFAIDKSWGCGSSQKLIARGHGRTRTLLTDIRNSAWDVRTRSNGRVAYVFEGNTSYRVVGDRVTFLGDGSEGVELGAVDAADNAISYQEDRVLRWSVAAGWRVLYAAP